MSWLIDELNNQNIELRQENFKLHRRVNFLIEDISKQITEIHELKTVNEKLEIELDVLKQRNERSNAVLSDMALDLNKREIGFFERIKLFIRGRL